jgi:hypoxanthine phosphoribosyltransferase
MNDYRLVPFISSEAIQRRLDELAGQIDKDYDGRELVVIGILKGAFVFLSDLVRKLSMPVEVDFVRLASYGAGSETSGKVEITKDIELSIDGRDVLVVEDIVDTGITLAWYLENLKTYNPRSVRVCVLIDKYERRRVDLTLDYVGISMEKGFIVGYGLDFSEKHRNLPEIYKVQFI